MRRPLAKRPLVLALMTAMLASLIGVGGWWWSHERRMPVAPVMPLASLADSSSSGVRSVRLYFAAPSGDSLVSESREVVGAATPAARVRTLVAELDRGPRGRGVGAIPAGTAVLRVFLDDTGLMTLDLSGAFRQGFRGGATAEYLAIASLVRTLGANLPEVKHVLIVCAGRPIATLGGHFPLDQPLDVNDWP